MLIVFVKYKIMHLLFKECSGS